MVGEGASPQDVQMMRQMGMSPISEDRQDWGYSRLSHEHREMQLWMIEGRPPLQVAQPMQIFDFRYAFTSIQHAKDYFQVLLRVKTEANTQGGVTNLTRTALAPSGLPQDSEYLVLTGTGTGTSAPSGMASLNALFRVGRICAKVYISCVPSNASQADDAIQKALSLASRAAAKSWEAAQEPYTVSTTTAWETARARVLGEVV